MPTKSIVCLTRSWRPGGLCIAGKEREHGKIKDWVRPISEGESEAVPYHIARYQDGSEVQLLDVIEMELGCPTPHDHQRENWTFNSRFKWRRAGSISRQQLAGIRDNHDSLWENGYHSNLGKNDRVHYEHAKHLKDSLRLIQVERLVLLVHTNEAKPYREVRGEFIYKGIKYVLHVTDEKHGKMYQSKADGRYPVNQIQYLAISLGEEFDGYCYKLIAGIM